MSAEDAVVRGTVVAKIHRMLDTIEARDAEIAQLRAERDASRLIISDLTAEVERLRAAGDRLAAAGNAVACSGPRDEMAELVAAYINWQTLHG